MLISYRTISLLSALAGAALLSTACGAPEPPVVADPALADVVFEGGATAPALAALLAATPVKDPVKGPTIDSPPDQSLFRASSVPTFEWHPGTPMTASPGYFLLFSTTKSPRLLRVFTTKTSYTPDDDAWATLRSAGMWTKLSPFSASFADERMLPSSGPFGGAPIEFCIEE